MEKREVLVACHMLVVVMVWAAEGTGYRDHKSQDMMVEKVWMEKRDLADKLVPVWVEKRDLVEKMVLV